MSDEFEKGYFTDKWDSAERQAWAAKAKEDLAKAESEQLKWIGAMSSRQETINQATLDLSPGTAKMLLEILDHLGTEWRSPLEGNVTVLARIPKKYTESLLGTHLKFKERRELTVFLLANRVPPTLVVQWYTVRKMLKDFSAKKDVADLLTKFAKGEMDGQAQFMTFHINLRSTAPVNYIDEDGNMRSQSTTGYMPNGDYEYVCTPSFWQDCFKDFGCLPIEFDAALKTLL